MRLLERQVRQMVRLIDDLVDVSRIRVGKIELRAARALDDVVNAAWRRAGLSWTLPAIR
jgi:signal transduction histidine kinase